METVSEDTLSEQGDYLIDVDVIPNDTVTTSESPHSITEESSTSSTPPVPAPRRNPPRARKPPDRLIL